MLPKEYILVNANQAVANVAYRTNDIFPIYPITPSSEMSELVEEWSALEQKNMFDNVPHTFEMQSEAGVAGAMHGALQTGSLTSTFTSSQGLLLMMPNMYKIAAELSPNVIHVATRSVATHALSIFGDHSDVMAVRTTGYAMLSAASVQEAMDFALISQAASLASRIPFVHFFDGFRTSHEVTKVVKIQDDTLKAMIDINKVKAHRERALNPNKPVLRGTSQGPDVFFQSREVANPLYQNCPSVVQNMMDEFAVLTGRQYKIFEYSGHKEAEQVIIAMASACETLEETVKRLNDNGERVGVLKVRLFRPFSVDHLLSVLPKTCRAIAVLDRTKESGSVGEPLFLDVLGAVAQSDRFVETPKVVGGRYGLGSKEFTPGMVHSIVANLRREQPKNRFTIGITDDLTQSSLRVDVFELPNTSQEILFYETKTQDSQNQFNALIQLFGKEEGQFVQGFQEIDYRKSESRNVTNLRISKEPIKAPYLITDADVVACESIHYLENDNVFERIKNNGMLIILSELSANKFWDALKEQTQFMIRSKDLKLFIVDRFDMEQIGICLTGQSPLQSIGLSLNGIQKTEFGLKEVPIVESDITHRNQIDFEVENNISFIEQLLSGNGNELPVSSFPLDGTYQTGTSELNKRNIAKQLPQWNSEVCTQCGLCSVACPSGALRAKAYNLVDRDKALESWELASAPIMVEDIDLLQFTVQINPEQCTGCNTCVDACPVKALVMEKSSNILASMKTDWNRFDSIPEIDRGTLDVGRLNHQQFLEPLFKYSMGEDGCGEAPYLKMLSQLFGDRMLVANATGASSIFGGALPTTPWSKNKSGRGPAWSNSLFEDNAEFGLGFRLSLDQQTDKAQKLLAELSPQLENGLASSLIHAQQTNPSEIEQQRIRVKELNSRLQNMNDPNAKELLAISDALVAKSVWMVGGDGWAYDIGYGGLDHVLSSGKNVNILVLDNEVYSNTGGQMSKATPFGASAKFASQGKMRQKKDLGRLAMQYDDVYVASVAIGADPEQTLKAFLEAEAHNGPSLIIGYCHSVAHGIDAKNPSKYHKAVVGSGQWLLYRNNPDLRGNGLPTLQLDSDIPYISIAEYLKMEGRFRTLMEKSRGADSDWVAYMQKMVDRRYARYKAMAGEFPIEMEMV